MNKKQLNKILLALVLFVVAHFAKDKVQIAIYLVAYLVVGFSVLKEAFTNILHGQVFDENFLMSIASLGAIAIGEYPEGVFVMLFAQIGELFENYAVNNSRKSISTMLDLQADTAQVFRDNKWVTLDCSEIVVDDVILLSPGDLIPVDALVLEGNSSIDTSALTGESMPVEVSVGSDLKSGCINLDGSLKIKAVCEQAQSTAAKVLELVENAASEKAKTERFITVFARYYTPIVVVLALVLAIVPTLLGYDFTTWLYRALMFLVVSCPCALVISVPLGFFSGLGVAAKEGILIKGSNYLEVLAKTSTIVSDKTGTLTKGIFEVSEIYACDGDKAMVLNLAAMAEFYSTHPLASALKQSATNIDEGLIGTSKEQSGFGVITMVDNCEIRVGNEGLMAQANISVSAVDSVGTVVHIAKDNVYVGYVVLKDVLKNHTKEAFSELKDLRKVILSGDNKSVVKDVADEVGIDEYYAQMLPQDKVEKFREIKTQSSGAIIYIGDGLNDAPVLALADVGIAMGALGSQASIEVADMVIMDDNLMRLPKAIEIAKRTMRIVKQNIVFALSVKFVILVLSALGIANMWMAVFGDVGVSIIAICNSMRLFLKKN